ncbi:DnaJ domain-containing protein [Sorangium sp. So ce1024]|uniref:J domain-containing protein n=1 Tax=Sorangium sp. So ce1024 TaxID=3133327 RepID=UPI003F09A6B1
MTLRVPRLKPGYDLKSLPLKPAEAFLLSRIDGVVTDRDLSLITGMSHGDTVETLRRLRDLGAIVLDGDVAGQPPPRGASEAGRRVAAADPERSLSSGGEPVPPLGRDALHQVESPPLYDPAELDEPVELTPERKRRILDLYYRLEDLSYYALLGVSDQADKKQIKSAYYLLAPEFHPDTYFRKQLGSYKQKIEAIFTRITLAHDTLTSKQRRAEYDAYLEQTHKNRAMAALIEQTPRDIATITTAVDASVRAAFADARDVAASPGRYSSERLSTEQAAARAPAVEQAAARAPAVEQAAARAPAVEQAAPAAPLRSASPAPPSHEARAADGGGAPARSSAASAPVAPAPTAPSAPTAKDRRETFARKLTGGLRRPPAGASSPAPVAASATAPAAAPPAAPAATTVAVAMPKAAGGSRSPESMRAVESLKARYDAARSDALRNQIARHAEAARVALERNDHAAAANAYRIAASLAPDDLALQKASADAQRLAAATLADGYLKQAHYEAQNGRWFDAALSYVKVCNGRPDDAGAHERVAYATLQTGENTRRAVEYARRAVELVPGSVEYRLTLALAYSAAGLAKSSTGELDRAAELAGNDPRLRGLVAQAREQARRFGKPVP